MDNNEFQDPLFGEIVDLVKLYEESIKENHPVYFDEEKFELIIQFYIDNHEYNKAIKVIDGALEQHSFNSFFYIKKAEILANQKHFSEAIDFLEEAQNLDPTDINIYLIRADVYLWQSAHNLAMKEVEYALSIASTPADKCELYLEMSDIWEDMEKYDQVIEALKTAIQFDPGNEEALNRFWFCTELLQQYEASAKFHEELIERNPYSHLAWFNLGCAYVGLGMYEKALDAFSYVIAIDETFEAAYSCYADVKYSMEQYDDALNYYLEAVRLSKQINKELLYKIGETYERLGNMSKARSYLRKAISIDPYYDEAFFKIGETYTAEQKWEKAIESYERAVKLNKKSIVYLAVLADAYMNIDDTEKAIDAFERIFQLDPNTKQNWINLATIYFSTSNYRKAFQVLTEAEDRYEDNADIFYIKAVFYLQIGNRTEGIANLERGLSISFDEHPMIFELYDSLLDDADILQVIEQYRD